MNKKTINDILPVVDGFIKTYQDHRNTIGVIFGGMTIDRVTEIINLIKDMVKK